MSIDFSDTGFETQEPLVTTSLTRDDENEGSLAPQDPAEYIRQEKAKGNLEVFIQAAEMRGEPWTTFCFTARRPGQNHPQRHHCQRDGGQYPHHLRPRH